MKRKGGLPTNSAVTLALAVLGVAVVLAVSSMVLSSSPNPFAGCPKIMGELVNTLPSSIEACGG